MFNFLFSLLTAVLPLILFTLTDSPSTSGYVMTTFMLSLLFIRVLLIRYHFNLKRTAVLGLFFYTFGFFLLLVSSNSVGYFYIGSILLGIGVGAVAPVLITMITSINDGTKKMVGLHNSFMAVASATAPIVGVSIYYSFLNSYLYLVLFILSTTILLASFFIKFNKQAAPKNDAEIRVAGALLKTEYLSSFSIFLMVSISYGSIIAYLPIYLEQQNLRIDIFYLFFWSFFIISQVYIPRINKIIEEKFLLLICVFLIGISTFLISVANNHIGFILIAAVFGFSFGALTNLFYNKIALVKDEKFKTGAFSIFGLMSYLGVGLGSFIFSFVANVSLSLLFIVSSIFPLFALMFLSFFYLVKKGDYKRKVQGDD